MPRTPRIRPYKDFLTPALHRRFALATATLLGICYLEAVYIGEWNSLLWSWFPLGMVGIRTGLFFISGFMIFVLRVAQLHVGYRTSNSGFETFMTYAPKFQTIQTALWYLFSAWFFSEVYIWSVPESADLNRIKLVSKTGRPILNERPIYLTSFLLLLAIVQSGFHLWYDYDRIDIPLTKTGPEVTSEHPSHTVEPPRVQLKERLPAISFNAIQRVVIVSVISPFIYANDFPFPIILPIYTLNIRNIAWGFTRSWAKIFWKLPKSASPPTVLPFHYTVWLRTIMAGFMLTLIWEVGNAAFSIYVAQEPLKNDRPITYESKDPNGSLLTGLRGKKLQTRAFAFWELVHIAQRYQGRRKAIFEDIDRVGGSAWSQILSACLDTIEGITFRIEEYDPTKKKPVIDVYETVPREPVSSLPRLTAPLKDQPKGGLMMDSAPSDSRSLRMIDAVGSFAKSQGQLSPPEQRSRSQLLNKERTQAAIQAALPAQFQQPEGFSAVIHEKLAFILNLPIGIPFRQVYRRRLANVILGSPYGDAGIFIDAIDSITRFAVCSLVEDKYGKVQNDIKTIIQTYTKTITRIQKFKENLGIHWTDVERNQECPEVDLILATLKGGLRELIEAFEGYAGELRLTHSDMRLAREASIVAPPPAQHGGG